MELLLARGGDVIRDYGTTVKNRRSRVARTGGGRWNGERARFLETTLVLAGNDRAAHECARPLQRDAKVTYLYVPYLRSPTPPHRFVSPCATISRMACVLSCIPSWALGSDERRGSRQPPSQQ